MRVIILGCGYLGYNLYELLKQRFETELWGIESPYSPLVPEMINVNAFDPGAMAEQNLKDAVVIDAIGLIANNASAENEEEALNRLYIPYSRLITSLKLGGVSRFVFFSSGGTIYGNTDLPISEDHPIAPMSLYARSKAGIEDLIRKSDLPYLILRLSNPYGGYQIAEKKQGVIPILIRRALRNEPFEMYVSGDSVRDYFYISDLGQAVTGLLECGAVNDTVNVGSGQGTSLHEIIRLVQEATGETVSIIQKASEMPVVQSIVLNIDKLKRLTGYEPVVSLREGIAEETLRIKKETEI